MSTDYSRTRLILEGLCEIIACRKCKERPERPTRYVNCEHLFCYACTLGETECFVCKVPLGCGDAQPCRLVQRILDYCRVVVGALSESEDSKILSKAIHTFSLRSEDIVPETDSESGDEVVESTPPGRRGAEKKNTLSGNLRLSGPGASGSPGTKESEGILQPETRGFVSPTQFSPRRRKETLQPETKGFVSPTQFTPRAKKSVLEPETKGFVSPTQFSPRRRKILEPETKGFVSPTQFSPRTRKILQPETAGFVSPTQISPRPRKQVPQPETVGFVDPTQFSPRSRNLAPLTEVQEDAVLLNKSLCEREPEPLGYPNGAGTPPSGRKKSLRTGKCKFLNLRARQPKMITMYDLFADCVDPPQPRDADLDKKESGRREQIQSSESKEADASESSELFNSLLNDRRGEESVSANEKATSGELGAFKDLSSNDIASTDRKSSSKKRSIEEYSSGDACEKNPERTDDVEKTPKRLRRGRPSSSQKAAQEDQKISAKMKSRRRLEQSKAPSPKIIPKNVNKRNARGETPLHVACVKGQTDYAKVLLEAGAKPNTKDNANWTPLQEAVNLGHREICKMLLQAGASANTPAMDNRTALHDAAANDKLEEAALLLRYNANKNVYDKFGKRPIDYAVTEEMRILLADETTIEKIIDEDPYVESPLDRSIIIPDAKVVVLPSNLGAQNRKLLAQLATKLKFEVAMTFRSTVTHVIVETNERNITSLSYDVMLAILQGKWILNRITIGKELNDIADIDLELFEVRGAPHPGTPTRARVNEENQNPRLFNNCYFYFAIGSRRAWRYEKFEFTKEYLTTLVLGGQGEILNREPDPEDVKDYGLAPFHVAHTPAHPLYRCSHYIIYMPGKDEPRVKYNMPHVKTLPVGWFFECIEKFTLVDPALMGIA